MNYEDLFNYTDYHNTTLEDINNISLVLDNLDNEKLSKILKFYYDIPNRYILNRLPKCYGCNKKSLNNSRSNSNHYRYCKLFSKLINKEVAIHPFQYKDGDEEWNNRVHKLHSDNAKSLVKRGLCNLSYSTDEEHNKRVFEICSSAGKSRSDSNLKYWGTRFPYYGFIDHDLPWISMDEYNTIVKKNLDKKRSLIDLKTIGYKSIVLLNGEYFYLQSIAEFIVLYWLIYNSSLDISKLSYSKFIKNPDTNNWYYTDFLYDNRYNIEVHEYSDYESKSSAIKTMKKYYNISTYFISLSKAYEYSYILDKLGYPIFEYLNLIRRIPYLIINFDNKSLVPTKLIS